MNITVLQEDLIKGLNTVGRVVSSRGQLPVLANVLLQTTSRGLLLSATNLELGLRVVVPATIEEEGAITVPAKNFSEFVGSLSSGAVHLSAQDEKMTVRAGSYSALFTGIAASEFPSFAHASENSSVFVLKRDVIQSVASSVAFAAASDESRPVLTGTQWKSSGDGLVITATDGFRMSRKAHTASVPSAFKTVILPAKAVVELARICGEGKKEDVGMETVAEQNQVIFTYGVVELVSRVLEGNFPDIEKIIPIEFATRMIVDREELLRGVRAASIFARDNNNIIKLKIQQQKLKIFAIASQKGEGDVELVVDTSGPEMEVAFNYRYLLDLLGAVSTERVIFESNGNLAPGVWRMEEEKTYTHIIMPVRM